MAKWCVALFAALGGASATSTEMFHREVQRMRSEHDISMKHLMSTMTLEQALDVVGKKGNMSQDLLDSFRQLEPPGPPGPPGPSRKKGDNAQSFLGVSSSHKVGQPGAGAVAYAAVGGATEMINQMILQVSEDHDTTTQHCREYFNQMCTTMESVRQDISTKNEEAADARACVLHHQSELTEGEIELPKLRDNLKSVTQMCKSQEDELNGNLQIVLSDIDVMKEILKLVSSCTGKKDATMLLQKASQLKFARCACNGHSVLSFMDEHVQKSFSQLRTDKLKKRLFNALSELAKQTEDQPGAGAVATTTAAAAPVAETEVMAWKNPPVPHSDVPGNPCSGISFDDAPGVEGGCNIIDSPKCWVLQDKFLDIQAGIEDTKQELEDELARVRKECQEQKDTLTGEIGALETKLSNEQAKLAECTGQENEAGEAARLKSKQHENTKVSMLELRKDCSERLRGFETEKCGLIKIRGEVDKIQGDTNDAFFTDCEVSDWTEGECSVPCGGGKAIMTRKVVQPPHGGAECPPLEASQQCQLDPCPVDCELGDWSGWSSCSAQCGGGVMSRGRSTVTYPNHGGEPCGEKTETESCNIQSCDQDCTLGEWTEWSICSKLCNGGHQHRSRFVTQEALGGGECAAEMDHERFHEELCNTDACEKPSADLPIPCTAKVDVIMLIDGSTSVTDAGFAATKTFADTFVKAFQSGGADAKFSIILFSGPWTWDDYYQCTGSSSQAASFDMKTTCGIDMVQHFADDATTLTALSGMTWPMGSTFTAMALQQAEAEMKLGRQGVETIVVTVSDGAPISQYNTVNAAQRLKDAGARHMVVPVGGEGLTDYGLEVLSSIASYPQSDNMVYAQDFTTLAEVGTIDAIIADICPPKAAV